MIRNLLNAYGAGTLGAVFNGVAAWVLMASGVITMLGSRMHPSFGKQAIYARLVWGGIFGITLLLPGINRLPWLQAGFLVSLFPTAAQLLYFFPQSGAGWFGSNLGWATPLFVLVLNLVWGVVTAFFAVRNRY